MMRVAVIRGGVDPTYQESMKIGADVLATLNKGNYLTKDIVVTKGGDWLDSGIVRQPEAALEAVDVAFLAVRGVYGAQGTIQKLLKRKHIPFTGSSAFASAVSLNRDLAKKTLRNYSIKVPDHIVLEGDGLWSVNAEIDSIYKNLGTDLYIKPVVTGAEDLPKYLSSQQELEETLDFLLQKYNKVLVEKAVKGRSASVGVVQGYRDMDLYILPPVETANERLLCPANFNYEEKQQLLKLAPEIHEALGCSQYSHADFILAPDGVYFLRLETLPSLQNNSPFITSAQAVGLGFDELVRHLVDTATV